MADTDNSSYITRYNFITKAIEYFAGADWYSAASNIASSNVTSYTPTLVGYGTCTNVEFFWGKIGDTINIWGTFRTGTVPASTQAKISLPMNINTSKMPSTFTILGTIQPIESTNIQFVAYFPSDNTNAFIVIPPSHSPGASSVTADNSSADNTTFVSVRFSYPV